MDARNGNERNVDARERLDNLDERLRAAARQSLTPEEIRQQSISFAMGMIPTDSTTTREYIEELVNSQYG
jgi:hypothetical protein